MYFGYMTQLWTTLSDYRRPKTCRCGLCTCDMSVKIAKEREEDQVYEFVCGLDKSYAQLRSTLISQVSFLSLDDVYLAITQEEDNRVSTVNHESRIDGVSFVAQLTNCFRNFNNGKSHSATIVCKSCGRTGHVAEQCFRTIRYPTWWGDKPRNHDSGAVTSDRVIPGSRNRATGSIHAMTTVALNTSHTANAALSGDDRVGLVGLSDAQWK